MCDYSFVKIAAQCFANIDKLTCCQICNEWQHTYILWDDRMHKLCKVLWLKNNFIMTKPVAKVIILTKMNGLWTPGWLFFYCSFRHSSCIVDKYPKSDKIVQHIVFEQTWYTCQGFNFSKSFWPWKMVYEHPSNACSTIHLLQVVAQCFVNIDKLTCCQISKEWQITYILWFDRLHKLCKVVWFENDLIMTKPDAKVIILAKKNGL